MSKEKPPVRVAFLSGAGGYGIRPYRAELSASEPSVRISSPLAVPEMRLSRYRSPHFDRGASLRSLYPPQAALATSPQEWLIAILAAFLLCGAGVLRAAYIYSKKADAVASAFFRITGCKMG